MSEYLDPEDEWDDDDKLKKETLRKTPSEAGTGLEKKGPNKTRNPKVLHKDGSLADLPPNNQPGGGALEGTVGIGT
ncbi:MAG TPA: hypothetical protein VFE54_00375 [Mucilaginibacter sp.]|jgi:hypothetical protein|nr:hypothetical protein [Mucilaginibacter sp.]